MSFSAIFSEFSARLGPDVSFAGPSEKDTESRPGRIVWQPGPARHIPPKRIGGGPGDEGPILTRQWTIIVDIWAADLDATVELANKFLAVAHDLLSQHSYQPGSEEWDTGGVTSKGVLCRMSLFLQTPIPRTEVPTVLITTINPSYWLDDTVV